MEDLNGNVVVKAVKYLQELTTINDDLTDPITLSNQLKTAMKYRHDIWVDIVAEDLKENTNLTVLKEPAWNSLTPDIIVIDNLKKNKTLILDVSFTMNHSILIKKTAKYKELLKDDSEEFHIIGYETSFEKDNNLRVSMDIKKKFVYLTDRVISKFLTQINDMGLTSPVLRDIELLHNIGIYKNDVKIKFTKKLRKSSDYLPSDTRETLPLTEKLEIITETIRKLLNENPDVTDKFGLEKMETSVYQESYKKCLSTISLHILNSPSLKQASCFTPH
jgi:hypothetical protein